MRYNEKELKQLASQLKCFKKEGHLFFRECQESFFRKSIEINNLRWCKLYNNLLFILKTNDQFSEPAGVIILENIHQISSSSENNCGFVIEFKDGNSQYFEARSESEKNEWIVSLKKSNCEKMQEKLELLRKLLEIRRGSIMKNDIDIETQRNKVLETYEMSQLWEVSIGCDNLYCNVAGKSPNPLVIVQIKDLVTQRWINYGKSEMLEGCSNAEFFSTILFRKSDGVDENSIIRVNLFDIREKFSQVSVPIGSVDCEMKTLIDSKQKRLLLIANKKQGVGFVTLTLHTEKFKKSNDFFYYDTKCENSHLFCNPILSTYRFVSGLGKEIGVFDWMFESKLSFIIPQQLLSIWISREKELIQEISGIGELDTEWKQKQMKLLDIHLRLLKNYSHAKKAIQHFMCLDRRSFKPSSRKTEEALEFIPVNLHLQRTNITCDRLNCSQDYSINNIYDVVTVGAFTKHTNKSKNGGLLKLLHFMKDSPSTADQVQHKIQVANENVQSIKQLRREVVNIMCKIISMARTKTVEKNLLPLCQMIIEKTRSLVTILEPSLVETTFKFIEEHRVASECGKTELFFERITQKISDLTSPEINTQIEEILINSMSHDCEEDKEREEFYRPSEEPPPFELIQLNLEASVMCLVAKIKLHCGRVGSPAVRIRQPLNSNSIAKYGTPTTPDDEYFSKEKDELSTKFEALINTKSNDEWVEELRPAMKKLSSAMDGLLKTARLVHSVHRLQQNMKKMTSNMSIIYHRDVCFSQSLTSLITALTARFWNNRVDKLFIDTLCGVGPLAYFEGFLSLYGAEFDFWSDMNVAIEDLGAVNFSLVCNKNEVEPLPKITGSRQALFVSIPVPEEVYKRLPVNFENFKVTVVFFNIGINEKATLAETLGYCKDQTRSNNDNYEKLNIYFMQYKKMKSNDRDFVKRIDCVQELLLKMEQQLKLNTPKNVEILEYAEDITRLLSNGLRFTSCKSAKDRTAMAVTLEQVKLLFKNYQLPESNFQHFLGTIRYGTRLENTFKNVGKHMYAFNLTQIYSLPKQFRPPPSTYGKIQT